MKKVQDVIGGHLGFKTRTVSVLTNRNINHQDCALQTLSELAAARVRDILRLKGAGMVVLLDCEKVLLAHGYTCDTSRFLSLMKVIKEEIGVDCAIYPRQPSITELTGKRPWKRSNIRGIST